MIRDNRKRFDQVIVVFTETYHGEDYREYIKDVMHADRITFLDSPLPRGHEDWRDVSVNHGLQYSNAEWVWFTEEDFFPFGSFWDDVETIMGDENCISIEVVDGVRVHPCCLFLPKGIIMRTRKNFGIKPDVSDHFSLIQQDLERILHEDAGYANRAILNPGTYKHMAGLSHNNRLLEDGVDPNHAVGDFREYAEKCLRVEVGLPEKLANLYSDYLRRTIPAPVKSNPNIS